MDALIALIASKKINFEGSHEGPLVPVYLMLPRLPKRLASLTEYNSCFLLRTKIPTFTTGAYQRLEKKCTYGLVLESLVAIL
jgi:hypothetical protein